LFSQTICKDFSAIVKQNAAESAETGGCETREVALIQTTCTITPDRPRLFSAGLNYFLNPRRVLSYSTNLFHHRWGTKMLHETRCVCHPGTVIAFPRSFAAFGDAKTTM